MQIEVLMFAAAREAAGRQSIHLEVFDDATADDVMRAIGHQLPSIAPLLSACRLAVDNQYVSPDTSMSAGCEVALIPPVSGG